MRLDTASAENFMSHKDTHIVWPGERVQVAGTNGVGKTSITVDAALWAIYGSSRGSTLDQLKGKWGNHTRVEIGFYLNKRDYKIVRDTSKKPSLMLEDITNGVDLTEKHVAMTQALIIELLGSENTFVNTVLFKQGDALRFALMTAGERKNLFDELVGIEAHAKISKESAAKSRAAEAERARLDTELKRLEANKAEAEALKLSLAGTAKQISNLEDQIVKAEADVVMADAAVAAVQGSYVQRANIEGEAKRADIDYTRAEGQVTQVENLLSRARADLAELKAGTTCPTCGSDLDMEHPHVRGRLQILQGKIDNLSEQLVETIEIRTKAQIASEAMTRQLATADSQIADEYGRAKRAKDQATSDLSTLKQRLGQIKPAFDREQGRVSILERDTGKIPEFEQAHEEQVKRVKAYDLITEAFSKRGIPRELVRGFVAEVERHTNGLITGLGDYRIELSLDKEGVEKKGVTEGTMDVWVTDIKGRRKLEMLSGGEKQRVTVALRLGIAMAVAKRHDRSLKTLIIDEALDNGLDAVGQDAVLSLIGSLTGFDRILFITHDPAISGMFPDKVELAANPDGDSYVL